MIGRIYGTGSYLPQHVIDNDALSQVVETSDAWIKERTGIEKRCLVKEPMTTADMAYKAANLALQMANHSSEEVDCILVSTSSPNVIFPSVACEVQQMLGAWNATCFDLNAACAGFLYAYNTAQAYIQAGIYQTVLVIGAETMSQLIDWKDRNTCILFGDGAGAVLLKAEAKGTFSTWTRSDGSKKDALTCVPGGKLQMNGQEVFRFAVKRIPECILTLLHQDGLSPAEIDYLILHQANKRILESVAKHLHMDLEKIPMNLQHYGNTSSASIPILLDELQRGGHLQRGMKLILAGFGAGLSWGASLIEW